MSVILLKFYLSKPIFGILPLAILDETGVTSMILNSAYRLRGD